MRILALGLVILPELASADRVISVPTGRKIPFNALRLEYASERHHGGPYETYLGFGATTEIEVEVRNVAGGDQSNRTALDFGYNFLTPIPDLSPGITVGVQDLGDVTPDGRRGYAAITYRSTLTVLDGDRTAELTLGGFFGRKSAPFIGLSLPMSERFRFLMDHNGERLAAGAEFRPIRPLAMRFFVRGDQSFLSLSFTHRF